MRKAQQLSVHGRMILWELQQNGDVVLRKNAKGGPNASSILYDRIVARCQKLGLKPQVRNNYRTMMGSLKRAEKIEILSNGNQSYSVKLLVSGSQLGPNPFTSDTVMPSRPGALKAFKNVELPANGNPVIGPVNEILKWPVRRRAEAISLLSASIHADLNAL